MTDEVVASASERGRTGFGDLFREFDVARRDQFEWLGTDPRDAEERGSAYQNFRVTRPVHTPYYDADYVLRRARLLRLGMGRVVVGQLGSERDITSLTRFYGGSIVGSYKVSLLAMTTAVDISTRVISGDLSSALPVAIEYKTALPAASTVPMPTAAQRERFGVLMAEWIDETAASSMMTDKVMHPAYQQIIGLGEAGVRLVLEQLEVEPGHWFWALASMAPNGDNPAQDAESIEAARDLWLQWGRDKGYLPDPG